MNTNNIIMYTIIVNVNWQIVCIKNIITKTSFLVYHLLHFNAFSLLTLCSRNIISILSDCVLITGHSITHLLLQNNVNQTNASFFTSFIQTCFLCKICWHDAIHINRIAGSERKNNRLNQQLHYLDDMSKSVCLNSTLVDRYWWKLIFVLLN